MATLDGDLLNYVFSPESEYLLVEQAKLPEKTAGGLYYPETMEQYARPNYGVVVALGPGKWTEKGVIPIGSIFAVPHNVYQLSAEDREAALDQQAPDRTRIGDVIQFGNLAGYRFLKDKQRASDLLLVHRSEIHGRWKRANENTETK